MRRWNVNKWYEWGCKNVRPLSTFALFFSIRKMRNVIFIKSNKQWVLSRYLARYQRRRKRRRQMTPIDLADESAHIFRQTQQTRYYIDNIVKFDISGNCIKVTIANG